MMLNLKNILIGHTFYFHPLFFFVRGKNFIEIKFTYQTVHPFNRFWVVQSSHKQAKSSDTCLFNHSYSPCCWLHFLLPPFKFSIAHNSLFGPSSLYSPLERILTPKISAIILTLYLSVHFWKSVPSLLVPDYLHLHISDLAGHTSQAIKPSCHSPYSHLPHIITSSLPTSPPISYIFISCLRYASLYPS